MCTDLFLRGPFSAVYRRGRVPLVLIVLLAACVVATTVARAVADGKTTANGDAQAAEGRIRATVEFLADDGMQGRGLGTKGLDRAAVFIGQEFARMGLRTDLCDGSPFQTFTVRVKSKHRRQQIDWLSVLERIGFRRADKQGAGGKKDKTGTRGGGEVEGKGAGPRPGQKDSGPALRSAPATPSSGPGTRSQQKDSGPALRYGPATPPSHPATRPSGPGTRPNDTRTSSGGPGSRPDDPSTRRPGSGARQAGRPENGRPRTARIKNVVAALPGRGPKADETIVIGAHYDHLGEMVDEGGELIVYNGANDNASGTAALLEVARILSGRKEKLRRRIVLVAFSGEEHGLLGSLHYVGHPPVPLEKTIAMINLDMVGRLEDDQILAMGTGSSPAMAQAAERVGREHGIHLLPIPFSLPCSDHAPFYSHGVPVIFFATSGGLSDYHRPSDDAEKLDYAGIRRVAEMTADLAVVVAEMEERPEFVNEGLPGTLLRGVVRFFGRAAKEMVTEKAEKSKEAAPGK